MTGSISPDGVNWTQVGATVLAAGDAAAGLAVTSHDASVTNTATFGDVRLSRLPSSWSQTDVGAVGLAGNASEAGGVFRVGGAGSDIWGSADSFTAVTQAVRGDGTIVARVTSEQNTHVFAKAGVIVGGLAPDGARVILDAKPDGGIEFMARFADGQAMSFIGGAGAPFPIWMKLSRAADQIAGSFSQNGSTWTTVGAVTMALPDATSMGLAVTSHDPGVLNSATFDNISVTAAVASAGSNLLQDSGFESDTPPALAGGGWISDTYRQTRAQSETAEPHSGARNGACRTTAPLDCGLYQEVVAPVTGAYTLTIHANASRPGAWVGMNVNGTSVASSAVEVRAAGSYGAPYQLTSACTSGDLVRVWLYSPAAPGSAVIDDVTLTRQ